MIIRRSCIKKKVITDVKDLISWHKKMKYALTLYDEHVRIKGHKTTPSDSNFKFKRINKK